MKVPKFVILTYEDHKRWSDKFQNRPDYKQIMADFIAIQEPINKARGNEIKALNTEYMSWIGTGKRGMSASERDARNELIDKKHRLLTLQTIEHINKKYGLGDIPVSEHEYHKYQAALDPDAKKLAETHIKRGQIYNEFQDSIEADQKAIPGLRWDKPDDIYEKFPAKTTNLWKEYQSLGEQIEKLKYKPGKKFKPKYPNPLRPPKAWWSHMHRIVKKQYPRRSDKALDRITAGIWWNYDIKARERITRDYENPVLPCPACKHINRVTIAHFQCISCGSSLKLTN